MLKEQLNITNEEFWQNDAEDSNSVSSVDLCEGGNINSSNYNSNKEVKQLTHEETKQIWVWKLLVILLIGVTAASVSSGAYKFLTAEENGNYDDNVRGLDLLVIMIIPSGV